MTTKTIKTLLFASLIAAMILPFSSMMMAEAAPNSNANERSLKQQYDEVSQQHRDLSEELQEMHSSKRGLTIAQNARDNSINSQLGDLRERAADIQRQNIAAHIMPPGIEKKLAKAEKLVEDSIENLSGAYVNGKERTLKVIVATEEDAQMVRDLVGYIETPQTHLKVTVGSFEFSGCTAQNAECNPTMGRIQMVGDGNNGCRIAVPYLDGSDWGFLTAGHCVDNSDDVDQPSANVNQIGDVSDGTWMVDGDESCDCAWVSKVGSKTFSERIFDTGYSWGYSYYSIDDHNTPTAGTYVSMGELGGIVHSVEIEKYDEATIGSVTFDDMMYLDEGTTGGDSGGPVFGNITHDFHGIIAGGNSGTTIASHWDNIEDALDL